jgi:membrane associated rhomboid family serine protease
MCKTLACMIFAVCVVMLVVELALGGVQPLSVNPMLGPDSLTLAKLGSSYGWRLQTKWEVYRLFTPIFLHGGLFHILGNMLFLAFIGVPLEQKWGWRVFGLVFFVSGIAASLFSTCIHPNTISVGASGALFGLLGGSLADLVTHWSAIDPSTRRMQLFQQILTIVIWMMISFGVKYIDGWAHFGGLIYGFLIGCALWAPVSELHPRVKTLGRPVAVAVTVSSLLLMGGLFFAGVVVTEQLPYFPNGY